MYSQLRIICYHACRLCRHNLSIQRDALWHFWITYSKEFTVTLQMVEMVLVLLTFNNLQISGFQIACPGQNEAAQVLKISGIFHQLAFLLL